LAVRPVKNPKNNSKWQSERETEINYALCDLPKKYKYSWGNQINSIKVCIYRI